MAWLASVCGAQMPAPAAIAAAPLSVNDAAGRCAALARRMQGHWPDHSTRLVSAEYHGAGPISIPRSGPPGPLVEVQTPAHCEVIGVLHERTGIDGQHYAIRFHVRLPEAWNRRFFMQGGGGTNGELGDALGQLNAAEPALVQGYAVLSQDSGHANATNSIPERGGAGAFGFDPQARADYGGASLPPTVQAARALVAAFYETPPVRSYFVGCSKGGQEGLMLAERYPDLFDGIVAGAPAVYIPLAAAEVSWDTQSLAAVVRAKGESVTPDTLATSFSEDDLKLAASAVLAACDADDGVADGMVSDFMHCTSAKVLPELAKRTCRAGKQAGCLLPVQVEALERIQRGAHDGKGDALYPGFPWDAGWADPAWRVFKTGLPGPNGTPSVSVMLAGAGPAVMNTPPVPAGGDSPADALRYVLGFDLDRDTRKIYATDAHFTHSIWADTAADSTDLSAFARHGGKLIVPQGGSDPILSISATLQWWRRVDAASGGKAAGTVRVFEVPGMAHCQGGPATDAFDAFAALVGWVEQGNAPDRIIAKAEPNSPWPGRTRPLCPVPKVARYRGSGSIEDAASFVCE